MLKGGGREDYFQNIRRTLKKINPAHLHTHRHTHTQIHELTDTHRHRGIYTHTQIHEQTDTHRHTQTHTQTQTQTYTDTHRYKHTDPRDTHRHTDTHTNIHTDTQAGMHTQTHTKTHTQHTQAISTAHHVIFLLLRVLSSEQPFAIRQLSSQHYQWDFWRKTNMGVHLLYFLICLVLLPQQLWQNLGDGSLRGPQCNQLRFPYGR